MPAVLAIAFLLEYQHRCELVHPNLTKIDSDAQLQRRSEINHSPQEQPGLGRLRSVEPVQRAMVAPPAILRRVVAETRIAEFIPA